MPDWAIQLLVAGAIYGGIRADLVNVRRCAEEAKAAAVRAHVRIDEFIQGRAAR